MCGVAQKAGLPGAKQVAKLYDGSTALGKFSSRADPFGAYAATGEKDKLDPLNLNNAPDEIPVPPALQEAKEPDSIALRRSSRNRTPGGGTLLTSPSGVQPGLTNTGGTTLLGG
jgi:hypothetical protein